MNFLGKAHIPVFRLLPTAVVIFSLVSCQPEPGNQVSKEFAQDIASQYLEARNSANLDLLDNIYAQDVVVHDCSAPEDIRGLEALKAFYEASHAGFPDFQIRFDDVLVSENYIIFRGTVEGTHTGTLRGIPPTGKHIRFSCVAIDRIDADKIVEEWVYFNVLDLLEQLGFSAPMPPVAASGE
jgi:steroid delta-isomerase-like uncharacterized protein